MTSWADNAVYNGEASVREELDGLGNNVGTHGSFTPPERAINPFSPSDRFLFSSLDSGDCELDGILVPCAMAFRVLRSGAGVQCPDNDCGSRRATYTDPFGGQHNFLTKPFQAFGDGTSGFGIPMGIQNLRNNLNWQAGVWAQGGIASITGAGGSVGGKKGDPCIVPGTDIPGITDEHGGCNPSIGTFDAGTTYDYTAHEIDWTSEKVSTPWGYYVQSGTIRRRGSPAELEQIVRQIRTPLQNVGDGLNICGTVATVAEYRNQLGPYWRSARTGNWHTTTGSYTGNQWEIGAKGSAMSRAATYRFIGKATFYAGAAISVAQIATGETPIPKGLLDVGMGYVGYAGGPPGAIVSGTYFVYSNLPPPAYGIQGMPYPVKTNACHGGR